MQSYSMSLSSVTDVKELSRAITAMTVTASFEV